MFRIAKNLVRGLEQSVSETLMGSDESNPLDGFFQTIPPFLVAPQSEFDPNGHIHGLRVVAVEETQLQFSSYFDFIVAIDDQPIPLIASQDTLPSHSSPSQAVAYPDYVSLVNFLNSKVGSSVKFHVWSAKGGTYREEHVSIAQETDASLVDVPLQDTVGSADQHQSFTRQFQSLGIKVQWTPLVASSYTYHVLALSMANGPAHKGGLIPDDDYIIGCQDGLLATGGETLLQDVIRSRAGHSLVLYVHNKRIDCVRPVTVEIGPDGRLGCNVGYGLLHRIPAPNSDGPPPEIRPQSEEALQPQQQQQNLLSDQAFVPQPALHPPTKAKKKPTRAEAAQQMDDYFNEGRDTAS